MYNVYKKVASAFQLNSSCFVVNTSSDTQMLHHCSISQFCQPLSFISTNFKMAATYEDLPLKTNHEVLWAHERYYLIFESSENIQDKIPKTNIPGPSKEEMVPFMIEAPLSSVEILEALLRPAQPFQIQLRAMFRRAVLRNLRKILSGSSLGGSL